MNIKPYRGIEPALGAGVYVDPTALVIGDVTLGDDVSIWPLAVLRGDVNRIVIGVAQQRAGRQRAARVAAVSWQ